MRYKPVFLHCEEITEFCADCQLSFESEYEDDDHSYVHVEEDESSVDDATVNVWGEETCSCDEGKGLAKVY